VKQLPTPPPALQTSNTKLAAIYCFFGIRLTDHNPTFCADEVPRNDLTARPKKVVFYNFQDPSDKVDLAGLSVAFFGKKAHEMLEEYLPTLPLDPKQLKFLRGLISAHMVQSAHEIMRYREQLVHLVQNVMPHQAKWDLIRWSPAKFTLLPKTMSPEQRREMIKRHDRH
jgi:hypothetical protein